MSIDATAPSSNGHYETAESSGSLSGADFAAALRDFTDVDDKVVKRFARLNAHLRAERPAYPDPIGCRSWLAW